MPPTAVAAPAVAIPDAGLNGRRFGVEFEFNNGEYSYVKRRLQAAGLSLGYDYDEEWDLGDDGSLPGPHSGELRSPPLKGDEGAKEVALAANGLAGAEVSTGRSCGLHVHHECIDLEKKAIVRLLRNYQKSQPAINRLVKPSRCGNSYCAYLREEEIKRIEAAVSEREYRNALYTPRRVVHTTNLVEGRGTIEFRQHHGTVDAEEVLSWVAFGQALIAASAKDEEIATRSAEVLVEKLATHGELSDGAAELLIKRPRYIDV